MEGKTKRVAEGILGRVLKTIKPSSEEVKETIRNTNQIMGLLKKIVDKGVTIEVIGSVAKGTNLKGTADIDIFMLFDRKVSKDAIVKKGLAYAKDLVSHRKHTRFEIKYAEHPYARVYLDDIGIKLDLVPAYKLSRIEDKGTSVDRTPMHTQFINKNLSDKQRDDVRLLKYLLKAHGLYGAEVKTKGFSGYLCELLIYNFGSLLQTIEYFSGASLPLSIVCKGRKVGADAALEKRFNSRFVVVDPVDENRNVAAAVSEDIFAKFVIICKMFVLKPDINMFYGQGIDIDRSSTLLNGLIKKMHADTYLLKLKVSDKTEDIVWPQVNRIASIIESDISKFGFIVFVSCSWVSGRNAYILYLAQSSTVHAKLFKGPSAFAKNYTVEFMKGHKDAYGFVVRDGSVYALEKSKMSTVEDVIRNFVKSKNLVKSKDMNLKGLEILRKIPAKESANAYTSVIGRIRI